jgi:hypothetical protein
MPDEVEDDDMSPEDEAVLRAFVESRETNMSWPSPDIPKLPPRTKLDLSRDTVNVPNIPEFTIPGYLSVSASTTSITHPENLSQIDWMIIARRTGILYGYTMGTVPGDDDPPQAPHAALDWMIPDGFDYLKSRVEGGTVETAITYSAGTASYVRAGVNKQEASIGFPFASASFEREHEERHASSSYKKQLQLIGRWHFPRAKLILEFCTAASDRFIDAVKGALGEYDKSSNLGPLLDVFRKYGTAVPKEIILGGQMIMVHKEDYQGSVNEDEVKEVISAAVSVKSKGGTAQGTAGVSFQNGTGSTVTADQVSKSTKFMPRGGDTTKTTAPESWPDTVKPASEWAVIDRSGMTSILDFLPGDLRARAMAIWPKLPMPPAIWELQDTLDHEHVGTAERAQFVLGARNVPDNRDGARGDVELVCGDSLTPDLGRGDAGGRASFHRHNNGDVHIYTSSVCLPVPAGHNYAARTSDTWAENGKAPTRFAIAETNLTLDKWRAVEGKRFMAETDGFVFCSIEASNDGARGYVECTVGENLIAAASVHNYPYHDCWIRHASFCAPFAKGSDVMISLTSTSGRVDIKAWWIASTSQAWKFKKAEQLTVGGFVPAATDGFLYGVVTAPGDGPRGGILRLDCVKDKKDLHDYPIASAPTQVNHHNDRWRSHASAMVPVRKGYLLFTELKLPVGAPRAQLWWTGVVPVAGV